MFEPLLLRQQPIPEKLVVIRLGSTTLTDKKLREQCERTHARWGFHGFSVFELPDGDYERLARLAPIVTVRPKLFEARAQVLLKAGFPLLATNEYPHWTVVCSSPTTIQFERVRGLFTGPVHNPVWKEDQP